MTYLIDVNVLSEPTKPAPNPAVMDWLITNESEVVVDSIVLGEIQIGILTLQAGRKRAQLERWFAGVLETVECLPWDAAVSRCWAELVVNARRKGYPIPMLDSMIAATALTHNLTVATRNVRNLRNVGVKVFDPFGGT